MMKKQQTQGWLRIFHHPTRISKLFKPLVVLTLAGATLFAGCSKDDKKDEIVPQITRVYNFAPEMYDNLENLEQISASADSIEIKEIVFQVKNDGKYAWYSIDMRRVANVLEPAFAVAKGKGTTGKNATFKMVKDAEHNRLAEPRLNALGYTVEYYQEATQAIQRVH